MKMTVDTLAGLGACAPYVNTFRSLFPETDEQYRDGVEMTAEVCASVADRFDWSWAAEVILTPDGYAEWTKITRTRNKGISDINKEQQTVRQAHDAAVQEWQKRYDQPYDYPEYNTPVKARDDWEKLQAAWREAEVGFENRRTAFRAASFGRLAEDDQNLSDRYHNAVRNGAARRHERRREQVQVVEGQVERTRHSIRDAESRLRRYQESLDGYQAELPKLEEQLVRERAAFARFEVEYAQSEATRLTREAERAAAHAAKVAEQAQARVATVTQQADEAAQAAAELDARAAAGAATEATDDAETTA